MTRSRAIAGLLALGAAVAAVLAVQGATAGRTAGAESKTATPIKHLVVIFQENVSFDHYFGTYPKAAGSGGQPFAAVPGTPSVDG
jgi:phospholipase C